MPSRVLKKQFLSIPPFPGGKRRLCGWIFAKLAYILPRARWRQFVYVEAFMGAGSMSLQAKAMGFSKLLVNDWSARSQLIAQGLLENQTLTLSQSHLYFVNQPLPEGMAPGPVEQAYGSSVFAQTSARYLDQWNYWTAQLKEPVHQAQMRTAIWHTMNQFICIPTSINTSNRPYVEALDGLREWDTLNPKRFLDKSINSLLKPAYECLKEKVRAVNGGVFRGSLVQSYQLDAMDFIRQVSGDVLYVDSPYAGTVSYERYFSVVDDVLFGHKASSISPFSKSVDCLESLLSEAQHIPIWLISYGNKAVSLDELINLVRRQAGKRTVVGFAKDYKHMAHVSKSQTNQELLVIAYP